MKTINTILSNKTFLRALFILFLTGVMMGANIAFKEDYGHNMPISILMIFIVPLYFLIVKSFRKKNTINK